MVIECPVDELREKCDKINRSLYLSDHGTVYKNCLESLNAPDFVSERIKFVAGMGPIDNFNYPLSVLADENNVIYGYESIYYPNYKTIFDYIRDCNPAWLSFEEKKKILLDINRTLKDVNNDYVVGDINLSNILISGSGDGVIIDWENGFPFPSTLEAFSKYDIRFLNPVQNDAIKMFISSISLLYKVSFEQLFSRITVDRMLNFAKLLKMPRPIIHYLEAFVYEVMANTGRAVYFDEFLETMYGISTRSFNNIRDSYERLLIKKY